MRIPRRGIAASVAAVLVLGVFAAACSSKKSSPTATPTGPTSTPAPSATPTLPPATLDEGARLRDEGSFEEAARVYAAIAATPQPDAQQQSARLAQAQLLSRTQQFGDAKTALDAYLADAGAAGDGTAARYLLASTLDDLGDLQGAVNSYDLYIAANGPAADFARIERAKLLARLGQTAAASQQAEAVLASSILSDFKTSFVLSMGRAFEQGQDDVNALAWYTRAETYPGADAGSALARAGAVKKRQGDATWSQDYILAITRYPSSGSAPDLLDELDAAAIPVDDFVRGVVSYRAGRNDASRAALERAVAANDNAAQATYYLGALDERADDDATAITDYERSYALDPSSPVADDALWWRGRLLENASRFDEAGQVYATLAANFPASTWYGDAQFRQGYVQYKANAKGAAATTWGQVGSTATGEDALRARFWRGKALKESGDTQGDVVLKQLVADQLAEGDFYALRAQVLLGDNQSKDKKVDLGQQSPDWDGIAAYIRTVTNVDPATLPHPENDPRWAVATELSDVGLGAQSDAVFRSMFADASASDLYVLTKALSDAGRTALAARAATTLIASLQAVPQTSPPRTAQPPLDLLRLSYPDAFAGLTQQSAGDEKISPLLLLSLVRQESYFDPDAGSVAGALGLTQVVPSTGQSIASSLGVAGFTAEDLFRAKTSLRFGANYLAAQLHEFDDNPYHALAAYNGGPGATSDAVKSGGGDDDDRFVEELEFDETRLYVRLVMQNFARYRQLYEGLDQPSLPR